MFGLISGSCSLKKAERTAWMGHICGTCLALRDNGGQMARLATNYDAALISVLCEAQTDAPGETVTTRCPLRRQFKMPIVDPDSAGSRYAATVSLLMGAAKITDNLADEETALRHFPKVGQAVARRWQHIADQLGQASGFAASQIKQLTQTQMAVEAKPQSDFFAYSAPTELAVAAAFQHTALIANKPHNQSALHDIGRLFGRIMVLLDSYADYATDVANQKLNFLAAVYPQKSIQHQATRIFQESYGAIEQTFAKLDLPQPDLAKNLLLNGLKRRGQQILGTSHLQSSPNCALSADLPPDTLTDEDQPTQKKAKHSSSWYCCDGYGDCTCCGDAICDAGCDCCDCNCCDCNCCDCDCCSCN